MDQGDREEKGRLHLKGCEVRRVIGDGNAKHPNHFQVDQRTRVNCA